MCRIVDDDGRHFATRLANSKNLDDGISWIVGVPNLVRPQTSGWILPVLSYRGGTLRRSYVARDSLQVGFTNGARDGIQRTGFPSIAACLDVFLVEQGRPVVSMRSGEDDMLNPEVRFDPRAEVSHMHRVEGPSQVQRH